VSNLKQNLGEIDKRVHRACDAVGRDPAGVTLIAVTKTVGLDAIREAYDLGVRDFGESRIQEAAPKIEVLPGDITWHFIGNLQSNKAKRAGQLFDVIHTFTSEGQLREMAKSGRTVSGLIEVNIAEEAQKGGISIKQLDDFETVVLNYPHVLLRGLMTVGPATEDPEAMRPYFRKLRELNVAAGLEWLSCGMSGDFDVATQEGATHIRVGTALFGAR
jgi:PLP dependent protein